MLCIFNPTTQSNGLLLRNLEVKKRVSECSLINYDQMLVEYILCTPTLPGGSDSKEAACSAVHPGVVM